MPTKNPTHRLSGRRGFTLIELLVVISIIALLIAILLPALGAARQSARKIQNSTQLRGIHQALVIFAQSNKGYYPGLNSNGLTMLVTEVNATGTYTGRGATSNGRNSSAIFAIALNQDSFTPDYLISPVDAEAVPVGGTDTDLDFEGSGQPHNFSYANLYWQESGSGGAASKTSQESGRVAEWKESMNSQAIVLGDRIIGSGTTKSSLWTEVDSGDWEGTITYNDNATLYENTDEGFTTKYGGNLVEDDSLFETDGTIGTGNAPDTNGQRTDCRLRH